MLDNFRDRRHKDFFQTQSRNFTDQGCIKQSIGYHLATCKLDLMLCTLQFNEYIQLRLIKIHLPWVHDSCSSGPIHRVLCPSLEMRKLLIQE
jgi:hypothetical protein